MEKKKSILITGVAGLIGANFAEWLVNNVNTYKVIGIDNLVGGYIENVNPNVIFYLRDLVTDDISDIFLEYNIEYVYHFAAFAAECLSPFMRKYNYENNILATANVINNCIKYDIKRLIYTSSMSVYGHPKEEGHMFDESDLPTPIDPYAISKYACEMDIKVAGELHNLDWCIIRPHNVYGKYLNIWDLYRNVLGIWMNKIINNKPILIYGDGEQVRAFSYIDDYMQPFWNAATFENASKQIINMGSIYSNTLNEAAHLLCDITGYTNIQYAEKRYEVKYCVPTFQKSIDILGFKHTTSLKDGLQKMWEWVKTLPHRPQLKHEKYELDKGIYSYWK